MDISYGGENGFNQAIDLAADALADVKFIKEKKLISTFFDEISQDTNKAIYGVKETLTALEMGAIETLICWENLDLIRLLFSMFGHEGGTAAPHQTKEITFLEIRGKTS